MKKINFRFFNKEQFSGLEGYKIFVSVLFGLLGLLSSFFMVSFPYGDIKIHMFWNMIFPLMVTMAWGTVYGLISLDLGLTIISPLMFSGYLGWGCLILAAKYNLWVAMLGSIRDKRLFERVYNRSLIRIQLLYLGISAFIYLDLLPAMVRLNPVLQRNDIVMPVRYQYFIIYAVQKIIEESILIAISDVLMLLPAFGKLFRLKDSRYTRKNYRIILGSLIYGVATYIIVRLYNFIYADLDLSLLWEYFTKERFLMVLTVIISACLIFGGLLVRLSNREEDMAANLEAIIESTKDSIWLVNTDYKFITSNRNFIQTVSRLYGDGVTKGLPPYEMVPEYKKSEWRGYYSRAMKGEHFSVEITTGGHMFEASLNPIFKDGQITGVAVFSKDITDRKAAEKALADLNAQLEQRVQERTAQLQETIREQEAFTYTVSHDLKNPLKAIDIYIRFLQEDYPDKMEGEMGEITQKISSISTDMIQMIDRLLQYSTVVGQIIIKEDINLMEMIFQSFEELTTMAPQRKINLTFTTNLPGIKADKVLMKRVIDNIISNAIKFTRIREEAFIIVSHRIDKNELIVSFTDNGVGFDIELSDNLFNVFERLHATNEYEGSGIGLAIVRKIIKLHGGRTWLEGASGRGATIYITLPMIDR